jgi:hypothetical protein
MTCPLSILLSAEHQEMLARFSSEGKLSLQQFCSAETVPTQLHFIRTVSPRLDVATHQNGANKGPPTHASYRSADKTSAEETILTNTLKRFYTPQPRTCTHHGRAEGLGILNPLNYHTIVSARFNDTSHQRAT